MTRVERTTPLNGLGPLKAVARERELTRLRRYGDGNDAIRSDRMAGEVRAASAGPHGGPTQTATRLYERNVKTVAPNSTLAKGYYQ